MDNFRCRLRSGCLFVVLTIAAATRHSKLNYPTASPYYDSRRPQHHSSAQRDCRSQHDRILRRVADLHPAAPDAEGDPACYYRDGWAADTSGSGINVYYFRESSNAANGASSHHGLHGDRTSLPLILSHTAFSNLLPRL